MESFVYLCYGAQIFYLYSFISFTLCHADFTILTVDALLSETNLSLQVNCDRIFAEAC